MSKAFVKENDGDDDGDERDDEDSTLPRGTKNYITVAGAQKLREELKQLYDVERPEVVRVVSWAAGNGDRSENGDYIYGKRRLREIDRRIRFLTKRLDAAEVIDPSTIRSDKIVFGASVLVEDEDGAQHNYRIVGIDEANPAKGDISWISPLARALLNQQEGDAITFRSPRGEKELTVLKVEYK